MTPTIPPRFDMKPPAHKPAPPHILKIVLGDTLWQELHRLAPTMREKESLIIRAITDLIRRMK